MLNPGLLISFNKKNMRSLTAKQKQQAEDIKFEILCGLEYGEKVDKSAMKEVLGKNPLFSSVLLNFKEWTSQASEEMNRSLTVEEKNSLKASYYVYYKENG